MRAKAEVAQRDVVQAADQQQIDDDASEPPGDDVPAEVWQQRQEQAGSHLHDPDGEHRLVRLPG